MKRTFFTRMAIPLLGIAFGFFIGCSTLSSTNKSQSVTERDLQQRLTNIENRISENPGNPEAYYQKGDVLNMLAQRQNPPASRSSFYEEMQNTLTEAAAVYGNEDNLQGREKVNELLKVSWSFEHNQGVEILQTDTTLSDANPSTAASHFNNAIIIIPDSAVSYKMKARALYKNHQLNGAIQTLEAATNRIDNLPATFLEQLAYLYLENDQHQLAVQLYEQAESFSDANLNLLHGLANAYIRANDHKEAVNLLGRLVENEPENIVYRESYGMELYRLGIQHFDSLQAINPENSAAIRQTKASADTLLGMGEQQLQTLVDQQAGTTRVKQELANLHKNYAVHLTQVQSLFSESEQSAIREQINTHLTSAVALYEELAQQHPDRTEYWKNLYQAYSYLDMPEKATQAKAKANL